MRGAAGATIIAPVRPMLTALLLLATLAGTARAAEVAYVDGDQVWVATLDGQQKRYPARVVRFPFYDPEKLKPRS